MNSYSVLMATEHIQLLLDEAAVRRTHQVEKAGLFERIASAASSVKARVDRPADYSRSILPNLQDYPYRS